MAYRANKTVISTQSANTLNSIAKEIGGAFMTAVPLVKTQEDADAYATVVLGNGDFLNQFTGMVNKIAATKCYQYAYDNNLELFNKGDMGEGAIVENFVVDYVMPEGYSMVPGSPGDCFKQNVPDVHYSLHPLNSQLVYETTLNRAELSLCFKLDVGVDGASTRMMERLTSSVNWDVFIQTKYLLDRAMLDNPAMGEKISVLNASTANGLVQKMRKAGKDFKFIDGKHNEASYPTTTPAENVVCIMPTDASSLVDINSLANAFNLEYRTWVGRMIDVNDFNFTDAEQTRLDTIMAELKKQGLFLDYEPFTTEEREKLSHIKAVLCDENFFLIFNKLMSLESVHDSYHMSDNYFYHVWKAYSHNPFANVIFFTDYDDEAAPTVEVYSGSLGDLNKSTTDIMTDVTIVNGEARGTLKYVTGWTEFSGDVTEQSGNYIALKVTDPDTSTSTVTAKVVGGSGNVVTLDSDGILVARVTANATSIDFTSAGVTTSISLAGLTLANA